MITIASIHIFVELTQVAKHVILHIVKIGQIAHTILAATMVVVKSVIATLIVLTLFVLWRPQFLHMTLLKDHAMKKSAILLQMKTPYSVKKTVVTVLLATILQACVKQSLAFKILTAPLAYALRQEFATGAVKIKNVRFLKFVWTQFVKLHPAQIIQNADRLCVITTCVLHVFLIQQKENQGTVLYLLVMIKTITKLLVAKTGSVPLRKMGVGEMTMEEMTMQLMEWVEP
jgi:hypothetical protein